MKKNKLQLVAVDNKVEPVARIPNHYYVKFLVTQGLELPEINKACRNKGFPEISPEILNVVEQTIVEPPSTVVNGRRVDFPTAEWARVNGIYEAFARSQDVEDMYAICNYPQVQKAINILALQYGFNPNFVDVLKGLTEKYHRLQPRPTPQALKLYLHYFCNLLHMNDRAWLIFANEAPYFKDDITLAMGKADDDEYIKEWQSGRLKKPVKEEALTYMFSDLYLCYRYVTCTDPIGDSSIKKRERLVRTFMMVSEMQKETAFGAEESITGFNKWTEKRNSHVDVGVDDVMKEGYTPEHADKILNVKVTNRQIEETDEEE